MSRILDRLHSLTLVRVKQSLYLCISMPKTVVVMKWAPHPFNKFMKVKVHNVNYRMSMLISNQQL
jgi:hypothetical protein